MASFLSSPKDLSPHPGFVSACDAGRSLVNNADITQKVRIWRLYAITLVQQILKTVCLDVTISSDLLKETSGQKSAFLPQRETKWKKAFCSWYQTLLLVIFMHVASLLLLNVHSRNALFVC